MGVHRALAAEGAVPKLIAPQIGELKTSKGVTFMADASLETEPGFFV